MTGNSKFNIDEILKKGVEMGASDVHLHVGEPPAVRINGAIAKLELPNMEEADIITSYKTMLPDYLKENTHEMLDLDFSYEIKGVARFRVNLSHQLGRRALVLRTIPYEIKDVGELNLPKVVEQFANLNNGLVLITGQTGSGKSTTIAALIDNINLTQPKHIITIEDPVEFVFESKMSVVSQRQLMIDTTDFADGVKYALRQDPDIIFIGEIRDRETTISALKAAETGHLVFATVHTNDAVQTVNRIVNMFDPSDRNFIRSQLAHILRGTIAQKLIPLSDGSGRRPACEVLVATPPVKDLIEQDNLEEVYSLVKKGSFSGMITMNMSLFNLYKLGFITKEIAVAHSDNKNEINQMLRGVYHGTGIK